MPPRRPGGKYKGLISKSAGPETRLSNLAAKRDQVLAGHIARLEEKKLTDAAAAAELARLKAAEQDAMRQKFIMQFVSGKGNAGKIFKAWITGIGVMRQERRERERDAAWRKSCKCPDDDCKGGCVTYKVLRDPGFAMPFNIARQQGIDLYASVSDLFPGATQKRKQSKFLPSLAGSTPSRRQPTCTIDEDGMLIRSSKPSAALRAASESSLTPKSAIDEIHRPLSCTKKSNKHFFPISRWPCKCSKCRGTEELPSFLDKDTAKVFMHHKTGRRCLVDPATMRFTFWDATRYHGMAA